VEEKGKNLMSRIPFKRHFVILVTCILAIGVIVPIATFAKSNNSEPHRRPLPTKSHVAKLASGGTSFSITTDANCNIGADTVVSFHNGDTVSGTASLASTPPDPGEASENEPLLLQGTNVPSIPPIPVDTGSQSFSFIAAGDGTLTACVGGSDGGDGDELGTITGTVTSPSSKTLVILLQGINTYLDNNNLTATKTPRFDAVETAISKKVGNVQFLTYSYAGFMVNGDPRQYSCRATLENPLITDIKLLSIQIQSVLSQNPGTDTNIYLVGHSLGGVIAFGYLAALLETSGVVTSLPANGHLKGVITLDSPLGGVSSDPAYLGDATTFFETQCKDFNSSLNSALLNLADIFDSTTKTTPSDDGVKYPQGGRASVLAIPGVNLPTPLPSNEKVAEDAKLQGIPVLTIGNENDLLWKPSKCDTSLKDFSSTQWIEDEGNNSGSYGRVFTEGDVTCFVGGVLNAANHFKVFYNGSVLAGLKEFLPDGGEPYSLAVGVPGPDTSPS